MSSEAPVDPSMAAPATKLIIYAIPGSQFVFKVLAAIQSYNIPHYVHFVSATDEKARMKVIPSGNSSVPELQFGLTKEERVVVSDSEKILHWLDDNMDTEFIPSGTQASELSVRASTKTLAGMVWYYNWVNQTGYEKSLQKVAAKSLFPDWFPSIVKTFVVDTVVKSIRTKHRKLAISALDLSDNESEIDDEAKMRSKLMDELKFYQSLFTKTDQTYLLPTSSNKPTAVDFSVYAQVERLVGNADVDKSSDVTMYPAVPELLQEVELQRLWDWHKHMQTNHPVQFRNKRVPADICKALGI